MSASDRSRRKNGPARPVRPLLIALIAMALLFACKPFELREVLDGPQGKALSISPSALVVAAGSTATFSATGGLGSYIFCVSSGIGSIDKDTGLYTAPGSAGSAVVRVTDSRTGKFDEAVVTVRIFSVALAISPSDITIGVASSMTFVAIGGTPPYTFSIQTAGSGNPGINKDTGVYVAGSTPDTTDVVMVKDSATPTPVSVTTTVKVTPPTAINYSVPSTSFTTTGTVGSALPGGQSFTLKNIGSGGGTTLVSWKVYLSANTQLDGGDSVIASGTAAALASNASASVPVTGSFPSAAPGSYYLIVEVSSAEDTTPLDNVSAASPLTLSPLNIDYVVQSVANTGATTAGADMAATLTLRNAGSVAGASPVFWQVYASADAVYDGGDYHLAGGSIPALSGNTTSSAIPFNGVWPSSPGSWYLVAVVTTADDFNHGNDATASATQVTTTGFTPPNVNYAVSAVTNGGGTTAGKPLAGTFTYTNNGADSGSQPVYWTAYVSADASLQVGTDIVIDSGSAAFLGSGVTSGSVSFVGTWPAAPGTWHLIVSVSASDDIDPGNNTGASGAVATTAPNVDYTVVTVNNAGGSTAGDPLSGTFTYRNGGNQDGSQAVVWTAYLSTDATLQIGTDIVIDSGVAAALPALATSAAIPFSGAWPSPAGAWYLIVALTASEDVNSGNNATASGGIATTAPNVDYIVTSVLNTGPTTAGGPLSGSMTIKNQGTHAGTQFVPWRAYVSSNATLDATDVLITSGVLPSPGLAAGASSASIAFNGAWPVSSMTKSYYLLVEVGAGDDVLSSNNVGATTLPITVTGVSPVYSITAVPLPAGSSTSQPVSGTFTVKNVGNGPGAATVSWQAYASLGNGVYDAGDILIASGSFAGLAVSASTSPPYAGTWPATEGTYQIIVRVSAADAPAVLDAASPAVVVSTTLPPDYTASFAATIPWSGVAGTTMSSTGTTQVTIQNTNANQGYATISWGVYLSTDATLDGGDTLVQMGTIPALAGLASQTITFSGTWPNGPGGFYYLIALVQASDDWNSTNDIVVAPHPSAVGTYRYKEGAEDNSAPPPSTTPVSDTLVTALGANQSIVIEGMMDDRYQCDTYKFMTAAGLNNLSIRAMWMSGYDDIDLYLWDALGTGDSTLSTGLDWEPGVGTFDYPGVTPGNWYVSAYFWLASGVFSGKPYVILVKGLP